MPSNTSRIADLMPTHIVRTETVLSKLPIHHLAKRRCGIEIAITQYNANGEVDLLWEVSYNSHYGQPQQLAYRLDTLVVDRCIDAIGRPLPKLIRLGSLRGICDMLGLTVSGRAKGDVKHALHQNAGTYINAKLCYKSRDGAERSLETGFTRYSVIFTGQRLPSGVKADGVYLVLHDPYWEVLYHAPVRPLDYDYLTTLTPSAQRFYSLLSYQIFAALKYRRQQATMRYSAYCTVAPQQRYLDYDRVKKQMYKVHQPHLSSGYFIAVEAERVVDTEGHPDWLLRYTPGPKAEADYQAYTAQTRQDRSSLPVVTETDNSVASISSRADMKTPDPASAGCQSSLPSEDTQATRHGLDQVRRNSHLSCVSRHHAVSSSALTAPVIECTTVNEPPTCNPESTPSAADLVRQFYRELHSLTNKTPDAKELGHATRLITDRGPEFGAFFVEFACQQARESNYKPNFFGGLMSYKNAAIAAYDEHRSREQHHQAIVACQICDRNGFILFEDTEMDTSVSAKCPHDEAAIEQYEAAKGYQRI